LFKASLSIYRGYSSGGGLGELPGDPPGAMRGEQYVKAAPQLWDERKLPGLANAVRPWTTLYDDQKITEISYKLGAHIEGWSYFGYGEVLRFVARLGSGGEFGQRLAYFTHARAWDIRDFQNADDPGALLGHSNAFVQSWREGEEIPRIEENLPESPWKEVVQAKPWAAIRLVSQLYRACVMGPPVVMGVPYREFVKGGRLHQLISFARAALPLSIKRDCRIRVFTGRPDIYLRELDTHLVVVPEELASDALTARPDVALLDLECENKVGSAADSSYAQAVVDRFLKLPQFLLAYTGRAKLPPKQLPGPAEAMGVPVSYNLLTALGDTARMDSLLEHLRQEAAQRKIALDWNQLIQPAEWKQFSEARLIEVALSPATSVDSNALRQRARIELVDRGARLDETSQQWIQGLPAAERAREILELVDVKLVSTSAAGALMRHITGAEIDRLLTIPTTAGLVANLIVHGDVPEEWLDELTRSPKHLRMMMGFAQENAGWRHVVDKIIDNLISAPEKLAGINGQLPELAAPDPNTDLENYLNWAEFLARLHAPSAAARIEILKQALITREGRRQLFKLLDSPKWNIALKNFVAPTAWDADTGDLLLQSERYLENIGIDRILRLPQLKGDLPENVRLLLDQRMQAENKSITQSLIANQLWLTWREGTTLTASERRACAINWLLIAPDDAKLEEWKRVMGDLAGDPEKPGITAAELYNLRRDTLRTRWPQIKPFETEQLKDLAQLCGDLGVLAELAETANPASPEYAAVLGQSRFRDSIPALALRYLDLQSKDAPPLDQAIYLVANAGHRKKDAYKAVGRSVLHHLIGNSGQALEIAGKAELWRDADFQQQFMNWLVKNNLNPGYASQKQLLAVLNAQLADALRFNVQRPGGAATLARIYNDHGFGHLAQLLSSARGDDPLYAKLIDALQGNPRAEAWKMLIDKLKAFNSASPDDHPLMILAAKIPELPPGELERIDQHGWSTLKAVCRSYAGYILSDIPNTRVLPVLHLALALRDQDSLGAVARGILALHGVGAYMEMERWWAAFFESIKACRRRSGLREARDRLEAAGAVIFRAMSDLEITYPAGLQKLDEYMDAVSSRMNLGGITRQTHLEIISQ
jgi:hypothetical protein